MKSLLLYLIFLFCGLQVVSQTCIEIYSSNGKKKIRFHEGDLISVKPIDTDTILDNWSLELAKPDQFVISSPIFKHSQDGDYYMEGNRRQTLQLDYRNIQWVEFSLPYNKSFFNQFFLHGWRYDDFDWAYFCMGKSEQQV